MFFSAFDICFQILDSVFNSWTCSSLGPRQLILNLWHVLFQSSTISFGCVLVSVLFKALDVPKSSTLFFSKSRACFASSMYLYILDLFFRWLCWESSTFALESSTPSFSNMRCWLVKFATFLFWSLDILVQTIDLSLCRTLRRFYVSDPRHFLFYAVGVRVLNPRHFLVKALGMFMFSSSAFSFELAQCSPPSPQHASTPQHSFLVASSTFVFGNPRNFLSIVILSNFEIIDMFHILDIFRVQSSTILILYSFSNPRHSRVKSSTLPFLFQVLDVLIVWS